MRLVKNTQPLRSGCFWGIPIQGKKEGNPQW